MNSRHLAGILAGVVCFAGCQNGRPYLRPSRCIITDAQGAVYYSDSKYEEQMCDKGLRGYQQLMDRMRSDLDRGTLGANLSLLSHFHTLYSNIGTFTCRQRKEEIVTLLHELLRSGESSQVEAAVTHVYYDFPELWDSSTRKLLDGLLGHEDPYVRKFARLALCRMLERVGLAEDAQRLAAREDLGISSEGNKATSDLLK